MRGLGLVVAIAALAACEPWYRDAARDGRLVRDEVRTARELRDARAAGDPARAAAILRETVQRNPRAPAEVWAALVDAEVAAGQPRRASVHARWAIAHGAASPALRASAIDALARTGSVAQALALVEPPTLDAARASPALAAALAELATATAARDPDVAQASLARWIARYGEPDHPILRAARARVAATLWQAAAAPDAPPARSVLRAAPAIVRDQLAAGHVEAALIAYAEARPYLPDDVDAPLARAVAQVADAAGITALAPDVRARAADGDAAVRRGDLGAATAAYRAVVVRAPWWTAARRNLDALAAAD